MHQGPIEGCCLGYSSEGAVSLRIPIILGGCQWNAGVGNPDFEWLCGYCPPPPPKKLLLLLHLSSSSRSVCGHRVMYTRGLPGPSFPALHTLFGFVVLYPMMTLRVLRGAAGISIV